MISERALRLMATAEALLPSLSDAHIDEVLAHLLRLAGSGPSSSVDLERRRDERELGRQER
jgi:hypothetical protein